MHLLINGFARHRLRHAGRVEAGPHPRLHLRDGSSVTIRPIVPADAPLLVDAFERLSLTSRHQRFLGSKTTLTPADLRRFTVVDHHDHEALIALSTADGRAVGVARYVRSSGSHRRADVAVTVIDEWHRRGLAHVLVERLAGRARAAGIEEVSALIADDNTGALALLRRFPGETSVVDGGFGVTEYAIAVGRQPAKNVSNSAAISEGASSGRK